MVRTDSNPNKHKKYIPIKVQNEKTVIKFTRWIIASRLK